MTTVAYGWCRVEGALVRDTQKAYGYTLTSPIASENVFYGRPSIQIYNRESPVFGVAYKVVPIRELAGYESVQDIDLNYSSFQTALDNYSRKINISNAANAAQLYYEEFAIDESSVIFYDDSTRGEFRFYSVIYIDKDLTPPVLRVTAKYVGSPVAVDLSFETDDLRVYAEFEDGNTERIVTGYTIDPDDRIVTKVGSNVFKIGFIDNTGYEFPPVPISVPGVKRLTGIRAIYDGPSLYKGQTIERRYITVIAMYSDNSSSVVTSYGFPNGNILGNHSNVAITYNGQKCFVDIPTYTVSTSRLVAFYTGPNIEVDYRNPQEFDTSQTKIQIYYESSDGTHNGWESVSHELCKFTPTSITHEGINYITVQFTGKSGPVSCQMMVVGVSPEVTMTKLAAVYSGPPVVQGSPYSLERITVKAFYSDGTTAIIKNGFTCNKYIVENAGINDFLCRYTHRASSGEDVTLEATFTVPGIERDDTTESGYTPVSLDNNFPEAIRYNNRYRGPAESLKHQYTNDMIFENIEKLYYLFAKIETNYNNLVEEIENANAIKYQSVNQIKAINDGVQEIMVNPKFINII